MKKIALYLRISKADSKPNHDAVGRESNSILNQRRIIHTYLNRRHTFDSYERVEYCDDGYTGTNTNRPQLQQLLLRIFKGEIQILIMKDLSRLGRNYLEVGQWMEGLVAIGIRVISVGDGYDSQMESKNSLAELEIGIRNLYNDYYSKDLSQRIKSGILSKQKSGQYISSHPIMGYIKSEDDKHKLIPDRETAPIVKEIFLLALDGYNAREIAEFLNHKGIKTPAWYHQQSGGRNYPTHNEYRWNPNQVQKILNDVRYTGDMVGNIRVRIGVGAHKTKSVAKADQIIVEHTHEGIISKEIFWKIKEKKRFGPN